MCFIVKVGYPGFVPRQDEALAIERELVSNRAYVVDRDTMLGGVFIRIHGGRAGYRCRRDRPLAGGYGIGECSGNGTVCKGVGFESRHSGSPPVFDPT